MENRKHIKLLVPIFVLGFFIFNINNAFAYEVGTHAFLTSEIVKFYNQNFPNNLITNNLTPYLIDGSRREDDIPRWMNHFYDPVNNRGLTDPILGTWQKSKDWAQDNNNQNSLVYKVPATIASVLTALEQGKISSITTETNFTWQQAIKLYSRGQGDKEKAMFMLGHILHLIEDTSVPDHTRNDPHPGDSPYEIYTSQFNLTNPDKGLNTRLTNKTPIVLADLNSYFNGLANYSNNNFYSKDTIGIQSGYDLPQPDYQNIETVGKYHYIVGTDTDGTKYYLAVKKSLKNLLMTLSSDLVIDDKINNSYWSRLSAKSIEYGAGVINLFFQQTEAAKNNPNITKIQPKSFFSQAVDAVSNFFSGIFGGSDQNLQPVAQISLDTQNSNQPNQTQTSNQQTNQLTQKTQKVKTTEQKIILDEQPTNNQDENLEPDQPTNQLIQNDQQTDEQQIINDQQQTRPAQTTSPTSQCSFSTTQSPSRQGIIINEVAWMGATDDANNEWIELKNISGAAVNINNWQLIDKGEQIKINLTSINGSKNIPSNRLILLERTDDNSVSNITADLIYTGAISNTDEGLRLFDDKCNLIDEVLANPNWPAGSNSSASERKTMERDLSGFNWHTSTVINGTPKAENSTPIIYSGGGGNTNQTNNQQQTTSSQQINSTQAKILINEIQIAPTADRFIKLYNPNDSAINLTGYYIQRKTQTGTSYNSLITKTYFDGKTIPAREFLLISRSNVSALTLTESNTIQIKNSNGEVVDKVGWGQAIDCEGNCAVQPGENQSIKRKFQNNDFVDTDNNLQDFELQTSQANQAPSAFFVSSSSSNIVISEIYPDKTGNNHDFIELYNPSDSMVDLATYSLRILKEDSTSSQSLADFNGENNNQIPAKGFFLVGFDNYNQSTTTPTADISRSSKSLPSTKSAFIFLQNNDGIIDEIQYNPNSLTANQSYERKSFSDNNCSPAQDAGEFLGNGCFDAAFDIRKTAHPQNSLSLAEPRVAPTIQQNFNAVFSSSTMQINFSWQESQDFSGATSTIKYKIINIATSDVAIIETTSTEAKIAISEIGRDYQFSIQAFDKDGLGSEMADASISVPSFISGLYFYADPRSPSSSPEYLIDLYFDHYPFIPQIYTSNISGLVFYLNSENPPAPQSVNLGGLFGCLYDYVSFDKAMQIHYPAYSLGSNSSGNVLVLPNILEPGDLYNRIYGGLPGGVYQYIISRDQLEDNHLTISVKENFIEQLNNQKDFVKVAFYSYTTSRASCEQILVAVDKTKYYFQENFPNQIHSAPTTPQNFNISFNSQAETPYFTASWDKSTDPDSLDWNITYYLDYYPENDPPNKQSWRGSQTSTQIIPQSSSNYIFELKAGDEFNLFSSTTSVSVSAAVPVVLAENSCSNFNNTSMGTGGEYQKISQSFTLENKATISSFAIGLSNCNDCHYFSGAKIYLRNSIDGIPPDETIYSASLAPNEIPDYYRFKDFSFYPNVELEAGTYFIAVEPENSPPEGSWLLASRYCPSSSSNYNGGAFYGYGNNQWSINSTDLIFRVKGF